MLPVSITRSETSYTSMTYIRRRISTRLLGLPLWCNAGTPQSVAKPLSLCDLLLHVALAVWMKGTRQTLPGTPTGEFRGPGAPLTPSPDVCKNRHRGLDCVNATANWPVDILSKRATVKHD
jgi:hypothetical protein